MGSGKTSIGLLIAKDLGLNFIDFDSEIEKNLNLSINDIFKNHGEKYFRELEKSLIKRLSNIKQTVISLGGGTFCSDENIKLLKKIGITIYLKTSYFELTKRYNNFEMEKRPLLKDENLTKELLKQREVYYHQANISILTDFLTLEQVKNKVLESIGKINDFSNPKINN